MTAPQIGYAKIHVRVKPSVDGTHQTVLKTVGWVALCLWAAQRHDQCEGHHHPGEAPARSTSLRPARCPFFLYGPMGL